MLVDQTADGLDYTDSITQVNVLISLVQNEVHELALSIQWTQATVEGTPENIRELIYLLDKHKPAKNNDNQ